MISLHSAVACSHVSGFTVRVLSPPSHYCGHQSDNLPQSFAPIHKPHTTETRNRGIYSEKECDIFPVISFNTFKKTFCCPREKWTLIDQMKISPYHHNHRVESLLSSASANKFAQLEPTSSSMDSDSLEAFTSPGLILSAPRGFLFLLSYILEIFYLERYMNCNVTK